MMTSTRRKEERIVPLIVWQGKSCQVVNEMIRENFPANQLMEESPSTGEFLCQLINVTTMNQSYSTLVVLMVMTSSSLKEDEPLSVVVVGKKNNKNNNNIYSPPSHTAWSVVVVLSLSLSDDAKMH